MWRYCWIFIIINKYHEKGGTTKMCVTFNGKFIGPKTWAVWNSLGPTVLNNSSTSRPFYGNSCVPPVPFAFQRADETRSWDVTQLRPYRKKKCLDSTKQKNKRTSGDKQCGNVDDELYARQGCFRFCIPAKVKSSNNRRQQHKFDTN